MISDSERREAARRLRGNPEDTLIPHRTGRHHGMGCREAADRFWDMCDRIKEAGNYDIAFSTTSVLADLIDPPYPDATASYKGWRAEVYDPNGALASPSNAAVDLVRAHADGKMRHSTKEEQNEYSAMLKKMSVEMHPVDRDALLELADRMENMAGMGALLTANGLEMAAASIREALGVETS